MLPCTKITKVENLNTPPLYWSETLSVKVEFSFDTNANEDFKTLLQAENSLLLEENENNNNNNTSSSNSNTPGQAWRRSMRKLSQAVVASTQVRQSPTSTNFTNSFALERPTFASTSHPSTQRQNLNVEFSSSGENPSATFILNLAIPYSCLNKNENEDDETNNNVNHSNDQNSSSSNSASPGFYFCEWEILFFTQEQMGAERTQMTHFSPFAVMRHAAQVSTALSITAQMVPFVVPATSNVEDRDSNSAKHSKNNNNSHNNHHSCLIVITCKNTTSAPHHVTLRHVELESPNHWSPALVKDYYAISFQNNINTLPSVPLASKLAMPSSSNTNNNSLENTLNSTTSAASGTTSTSQLSVADPWTVRRRTDGQKQFLYCYNNNNQQNTSTIQAPVLNVRSSYQKLVSLSDSLPITLKPTESYTFCFECYGWSFVDEKIRQEQILMGKNQQRKSSKNETTNLVSLFIARTTVNGRPVLINHPVRV